MPCGSAAFEEQFVCAARYVLGRDDLDDLRRYAAAGVFSPLCDQQRVVWHGCRPSDPMREPVMAALPEAPFFRATARDANEMPGPLPQTDSRSSASRLLLVVRHQEGRIAMRVPYA